MLILGRMLLKGTCGSDNRRVGSVLAAERRDLVLDSLVTPDSGVEASATRASGGGAPIVLWRFDRPCSDICNLERLFSVCLLLHGTVESSIVLLSLQHSYRSVCISSKHMV